MGNKAISNIFKPMIPFLPNNLRSRLVKLGPRMTRSWEKGAQELHIFSRNRGHVHNSQLVIQIWIQIFKWRIFFFQNSPSFGVDQNQPKNDMRLIEMDQRMPQRYERSGTHLYVSNGYPKIILYF